MIAINIADRIHLAETYAKMSEAQLAAKLGTSPQALGQRIRTGKFSTEELERIAEALGCKYVSYFEFPDGEKL